jgi:hypothetical protein
MARQAAARGAGTTVQPLYGQPCRLDPARRCWDASDLCHRGFVALQRMILRWQPAYFVHGHTHLGYGMRPRELRIGRTRVVDAYGYYILRWPPLLEPAPHADDAERCTPALQGR